MAQISGLPCEGIPEWQTERHRYWSSAFVRPGLPAWGARVPDRCQTQSRRLAEPIETLMINGTECEPYITADDTLMQCQADELVEGATFSPMWWAPSDMSLALRTTNRCDLPRYGGGAMPVPTLRWRASRPSIPRAGKSNLLKS